MKLMDLVEIWNTNTEKNTEWNKKSIRGKGGILVIETALPTKAHHPIPPYPIYGITRSKQGWQWGRPRHVLTSCCPNTQIHKYTNAQIHKDRNAQIHKDTKSNWIYKWKIQIYKTRSLGALRAPTSSLRPFGPLWLRPSRPSGAQAVWPM